MKYLHRSAACLVLASALFLVRPGLLFAEVKSAALSRGQSLVDGQQHVVALFMHPTATLQSTEYIGCTEVKDGEFRLQYAFHFKAWYGLSFRSNLQFSYHANGSLDEVTSGSRNAVVAPFFASDLALSWVKNRVADAPNLRNNPELSQLLRNSDSRQLLEWWLKTSQ